MAISVNNQRSHLNRIPDVSYTWFCPPFIQIKTESGENERNYYTIGTEAYMH